MYKGFYYSLGSRMSVKWDKSETEDTFILSLPAIAERINEEYDNTEEPIIVYLGVGLPIAAYSKQKQKFREYFIRDLVKFAYNGRQYNISIKDCRVYPQGYSAFLTELKTYGNSLVNVIDIGGYTTDFLKIENMMINSASCFSLPNGLITLFALIEQELLKSNIRLTENQMQEVIMDKNPLLFDTEIQDMIVNKAQAFVNDLLDKISERGFDMKINANQMVGGGSLVLEKYIVNSGRVGYYETLDAFCNAKGYLMLLEQEMKKKVI